MIDWNWIENLSLVKNERVTLTWNFNESCKRKQLSWSVIHNYTSRQKITLISNKNSPSQRNIIYLCIAKIRRIKRYYLLSKKISKSKIIPGFNPLNSMDKMDNCVINKYCWSINQRTTQDQLISAKTSSFWSKYH